MATDSRVGIVMVTAGAVTGTGMATAAINAERGAATAMAVVVAVVTAVEMIGTGVTAAIAEAGRGVAVWGEMVAATVETAVAIRSRGETAVGGRRRGADPTGESSSRGPGRTEIRGERSDVTWCCLEYQASIKTILVLLAVIFYLLACLLFRLL